MTLEVSCIRVHRAAVPWRDRLRAYKVIIDDQPVGQLRNGQDFNREVSPGSHRLQIKIDWTGSEELHVTVQPGETASFICEPAGSSWSGLFDLLGRRAYVSLRRTSDL